MATGLGKSDEEIEKDIGKCGTDRLQSYMKKNTKITESEIMNMDRPTLMTKVLELRKDGKGSAPVSPVGLPSRVVQSSGVCTAAPKLEERLELDLYALEKMKLDREDERRRQDREERLEKERQEDRRRKIEREDRLERERVKKEEREMERLERERKEKIEKDERLDREKAEKDERERKEKLEKDERERKEKLEKDERERKEKLEKDEREMNRLERIEREKKEDMRRS